MARNVVAGKKAFVPMTGRKSLPFKLRHLIDIVMMMEKHGQLRKFAGYVKRKDLLLEVGQETVNAVKEFVAADDALSRDRIGKKIIKPKTQPAATPTRAVAAARRAPGGDPFRDCCGFD